MTDEYKTLRELNVQPGDVVELPSGHRRTIKGFDDEGRIIDHTCGPGESLSETAVWRIVSRASDTPKPYTPGERQAITERPQASDETPETLHHKAFTGCYDKHGTAIHEGDFVRYNLEGYPTRREYWNPVYQVIFEPPAFTLKHVGGGKDGGDHAFKLRCGGGNGCLEIIDQPQSEPETLTLYWREGSHASRVEYGDTHSITFDLIERAKEALENATPGPWEATPHKTYNEDVVEGEFDNIGPLGVDFIYHVDDIWITCPTPDARLIALAPDLARLAIAAGELVEAVDRIENLTAKDAAIVASALARFHAITEGRV